MSLPRILFRSNQAHVNVCKDAPPGTINVNELLLSNPYWEDTESKTEIKPKLLVLADWTITRWNAQKIDQVCAMLNAALDKNFIILLNENYEFIVVEKPLVKKIIKKMPHKSYWMSKQVIISNVLEIYPTYRPEHIQVIDDYLMNELLGSLQTVSDFKKSENKPRVFFTSDLNRICNSMTSSIVKNNYIIAKMLSDEYEPHISHITHDEFSDKANFLLTNTPLRDKEIIFDIKTMSISCNQLKELLKYKNITYNGVIFDEKNLKNIQRLTLSGNDVSFDHLCDLFRQTPQLKKLQLMAVELISSELDIPVFTNENVEELEFLNCYIHTDDIPLLNQFLDRTNVFSKLSKMKLSFYKKNTNDQYIEYSFSKKDSDPLISFLKPRPNLNELELEYKHRNLVDIQEMEGLLSMAPCLKKLFLKFEFHFSTNKQLLPIMLNVPFLKYLEEIFIHSEGTSADLQIDLLSSDIIPNVKKFTIHSELPLSLVPRLKNIEEFCLEHVLLSYGTGLFDLCELNIIASSIKKITLRSDLRIVDTLNFNFDFSKLEELDLLDSIITADNFELLLRHSPRLKKVFTLDKILFNLLSSIVPHSIEVISPKHIDINLDINDEDDEIYEIDEVKTGESISEAIINPILRPEETKNSKPGAQPATDPIIIPEEMKDLKPNTKPFEFKGSNQLHNQEMVIEKISQYWTLIQQHLDLISTIQDGICKILSELFLQEHENWESLMTNLSQWQGDKKKLQNDKKLLSTLDLITNAIIASRKHRSKYYYIGNQLEELLKDRSPHVLSNAWHAAAIVPHSLKEETKVYDPNFARGAKKLTNDKVLDTIITYLGNITTSVIIGPDDKLSHIKASLPDPGFFIQKGGLIILNKVENREDLLEILNKIEEPFTALELSGLLLRDTGGIPAWAASLNHPGNSAYGFKILLQFLNSYGDNAISLLTKSLENLTPLEQIELAVNLYTLSALQNAQSPAIIALISALYNPSKVSFYEKQLEETKSNNLKAVPSTLFEYSEQLFNRRDTNSLIQFNSSDNLNVIQWALRQYCEKNNTPFFYAHTPKDLICSAPWIEEGKNNSGITKKAPGGHLYDLMQENKDNPFIILVNYENFEAKDIANLNGLLDPNPHADGTPLPKNTKIIGLQNINSPDCYKHSDFYSRFDVIEKCPIPSKNLTQKILPIIEEKDAQTACIKLYHANNWKALLLGTWEIKKNGLVFKEGSLISALKTGKPLEINNGLWESKEFCDFWQDAIEMGYVKIPGCKNRKITIPQDLKIVKTEGYKDSLRAEFLSYSATLKPHAPVLNPTIYSELFTRYQCDNKEKTLNTLPGLIEAHANSTLDVNLTRSLSVDHWGRIVDECKAHNVKLNVHYACSNADEKKYPSTTKIITSNDLDVTIKQMTQESKEKWQVVDISECTASDLLTHIYPKWDQKEQFYRFTQIKKFLLRSMEQGKKIILKGNFKPALADALAPFLLERVEDKDAKGQLVLMPTDGLAFPYLPMEKKHVSANDKLTLLQKYYPDYEDYFTISEKKLESMEYCTVEANIFSARPWLGMSDLPLYEYEEAKIDYLNAEKIAKEYSQERLDIVKELLTVAPYAFLTGLSGVGKTTFIQEDLLVDLKKTTPAGTLYQGEEELLAWIQDKTPGLKILFIDEANLTKIHFSGLEGLYCDPPRIFYKDKNYLLSKEHKIIFAGNPVSYSDDRKLADFFIRHGNARLFDPLPLEHIYHYTLRPIFENTNLAQYAEVICDVLFQFFHFIYKCAKKDVLITPRELEMMALLIVAHAKDHTDINQEKIEDIAYHYAHMIAKNLVPKNNYPLFEKKFPEKNILSHTQEEKKDSSAKFVITPSRKSVATLLDDLLSLRMLRRSNEFKNKKQLYGGLGGVILEGVPATGKSDLITHQLIANGYREDGSNPDKMLYRIPVSMNFKQKEELLLKAFDEGAVVVIDEINSSPMMERLLNALLMGKTPNGLLPARPGFMLIGTQNPSTMDGRMPTSTALLRRLIQVSISPYPEEELVSILLNEKVPEKNAKEMVTAFKNQVALAKKDSTKSEPTLRKLLRIAKKDIHAEVAKKNLIEFLENFSTLTAKLAPLRKMVTDSKRNQCKNIHFIPEWVQIQKNVDNWKKEQTIKYKSDEYIKQKINNFSVKIEEELNKMYTLYQKAPEPRGLLFKPPATWPLVMSKNLGHHSRFKSPNL